MIDDKIKSHFAKYTYREMEERDLRVWYVAYYAKTSEAHLRSCIHYERTLPKVMSLIFIAELFECSVNDLLGFKHVKVPKHDEMFNPGFDIPHIMDRIEAELARNRISVEDIEFDDPELAIDVRRSIRARRLPKTDGFLQICEALGCTPTELLGY